MTTDRFGPSDLSQSMGYPGRKEVPEVQAAIDGDPNDKTAPLLEPVLEYGPALTVSRFEGGGDYAVVYDLGEIEYLSDPDPLSPDARFLGVGDGDTGTPVAGATTSDGRPMAIAATFP